MEQNLDAKKRIVLIIIAVLLLCVGTTLAYIIAQLSTGASENVNLSSDTVDNLQFNVDKEITLNPNQFNVVEGGNNLTDTAVGSAILRANSTNDTATYNYYVYFQINSNNYIYTTTDQKPEIILTITDPTGSPVTSIDGLTYVESLGGFDITTKSGLYTIAEEYLITSNSSTEDTVQDWTFTVSFINLDTNQYENGGKTLEGEIILSKEPRYTLASYITNELYTGADGDNGLYYHDADLANGARDNSYRYAGANPNNYVCFGSDAATCPSDNLYRIIGIFGDQVKLIMADYPTTSQTGTGGAYYNTYQRWMGSSGSYYKGDQNMSSVGVYMWNPSRINTWDGSSLEATNLNSTFWNTFSDTWQEKIADATWYVGGYSTISATPATWHDAESTGTTWEGKIGLMYVSDYGFAASNSYWTTNVGSYNSSSITSNNWMHMGLYEWTVSRYSSGTTIAYHVGNRGNIDYGYLNLNYYAVRPVFYLTSDVLYSSGTGTESDPFRIA